LLLVNKELEIANTLCRHSRKQKNTIETVTSCQHPVQCACSQSVSQCDRVENHCV